MCLRSLVTAMVFDARHRTAAGVGGRVLLQGCGRVTLVIFDTEAEIGMIVVCCDWSIHANSDNEWIVTHESCSSMLADDVETCSKIRRLHVRRASLITLRHLFLRIRAYPHISTHTHSTPLLMASDHVHGTKKRSLAGLRLKERHVNGHVRVTLPATGVVAASVLRTARLRAAVEQIAQQGDG